MAKVAKQSRMQLQFFGSATTTDGARKVLNVAYKLTDNSGENMSRQLQAQATQAASKAISARATNEDICVTSFDLKSIPKEERGILVFSAPPPLKEFPSTLQSWNDALQGMGTLVIFTNDPGTRKLCRHLEIPTMCVEHTDEGLPRLDKMFERMHNSQPEGIVGYVNSDLTIEDFKPMNDLLQHLQSNELELRRARKIYGPFVDTGIMSEFWFAVATRIDVLGDDMRERHTVGGYDFWAWNTKPNGSPLLPFDVPPFRYPFATYDNWLLDVMVQANDRNVIDASNAIEILHHEHKRVGKNANWVQALQSGITGVYINRYLSFKEPLATLEANGDQNSQYREVKYML